MRRIRNLILFGFFALVVIASQGLVLRAYLSRLAGVNFDAGLGGRAELSVPGGFAASVYAEGLNGPRFMALAPDGSLLVAERGGDRVIALPDGDRDGRADTSVEIGRGYDHAHSIAVEADGSLLVAGETVLYRVRLADDLRERERSVLVDGLPGGGAHTTKTVAVLPSSEILLAAGASCDVCEEADERRAAISLISADGASRLYMTGLRNAVGLWVDPATGRAWATNMGRDRLGDDGPPETLYEVLDGADAGWPRCHAGTIPDPEFGTGPGPCAGVAMPAATFPAHMAPLALTGWEGHLVIAFHGSWNSSVKVGYALWWMPWDGAPTGPAEPFVIGFLPDGARDALGRPAGLAVGADGALYVSDDKGSFVYRIAREET